MLALAEELAAPLSVDLAVDHIQIATSIYGWEHEPGGGHIDGYGFPGQTEPYTFFDAAAIYLGDETRPNQAEATCGCGRVRTWSTSNCFVNAASTSSWPRFDGRTRVPARPCARLR